MVCADLVVADLEGMQCRLRFSCKEGKELSPVGEIIQEHLASSRCSDGMCEACDAKQQQLQGERTVTFCDAGDLSDNSCTLEEVTFLKLKETTVHYSLFTLEGNN